MEIDMIIGILHDQAIDGEFTRNQSVLKFLSKLSQVEKELLVACYWIGFNDRGEEIEE